jgi:hypothetical protein
MTVESRTVTPKGSFRRRAFIAFESGAGSSGRTDAI